MAQKNVSNIIGFLSSTLSFNFFQTIVDGLKFSCYFLNFTKYTLLILSFSIILNISKQILIPYTAKYNADHQGSVK